MTASMPLLQLLVLLSAAPAVLPVTFIVQKLSSRYAVVMGGYGPGYQELKEVEVVKHNKVCQGALRYVQ